jgi:hypothetical protein
MSEKYKPKYGAANLICALISFGGWVVLVLGVVGVIAGLVIARQLVVHANGFDPAQQVFMAMALGGSYISFVIALIGLLMVAVGQHLRATTDAANSLGEILALMKTGVAMSPSESNARVPQHLSTAKFCPSCGAAVSDVGSGFCEQCGNKL